MGIETEISRIKLAKANLKTVINAKGGHLTSERIEAYADAVESLPESGSEIDLSGVTVTPGKMLSGVIAVDVTGQQITGSIPTVTPQVEANVFTVGKGYVAEAFEKTIPESGEATIAGNRVTVPAGFLSSDRTETIPEATVTETGTAVTITPGYVGEELSYQLSSGDSVDLSFITATAGDIRSGKVGADTSGNPITGTLVIPENSAVQYGVVTGDGKIAILDLTGDEPVQTGEFIEGEAIVFATGYDDGIPDYDDQPENLVGQPLTFRLDPTADTATISFGEAETNRDSSAANPRDIYYRTGSSTEWLPLNNGAVTLVRGGDEYVQFKNLAARCSYLETADGTTLTGDFLSFVIEGEKVECYGDVNAMRNFSTEPVQEGEFYRLFHNCLKLTTAPLLPFDAIPRYCCMQMFSSTGITYAPVLPATSIGEYGYYGMFSGCGSLKEGIELPAKTLSKYCYGSMFSYCIALGIAPELPAETLAQGCYQHMFSSCTSLTVLPTLPATTLAPSCYRSMFYMCKALKSAPALPATEMAEYCYGNMFAACSGLLQAPALPATTLAPSCYRSMFESCTSLATAPALPAVTLAEYCYGSMFRGCASLATAPALPATTLAKRCYSSMLRECTSLIAAPALPAKTLADECYIYMFQGDTVLAAAPALPAETLTKSCYGGLFRYCPEIKEIHIYALSRWGSTNCANWLDGVAETGDIYCTEAAVPTAFGADTVPSGWTVNAVYI